MKPLDETWSASAGVIAFTVGERMDLSRFTKRTREAVGERLAVDIIDQDDARARLAACAPEMARMLLKIEELGGGYFCPVECAAFDGPGKHEHSDDCEWLTLMKKAGVRP